MSKRTREDWSDEDVPEAKKHKAENDKEESSPHDNRRGSYSPDRRYRDNRDERRERRYDRSPRSPRSPQRSDRDRFDYERDYDRRYDDRGRSSPYERYSRHDRDYRGRDDRDSRGYRERGRFRDDYRDRRYNRYNSRPKMPCFDEEDKRIREENPHLQQNKDKIQILDTLERTLKVDAPRKEYYQRKGELRSTNHWGQRKLLLSEIEFLTEHGHRSSIVVYAGAAPGPRNEYLADLFPKHKFVFIDPNPFHEKLRQAAEGNDRIELISESFTDELAMTYRGKSVLFISNIRTADSCAMTKNEVERTLVEDNRRQMSWHLQMEPVVSMLKFRLPWVAGITKYLSGFSDNGKLYLPIWGGQTTTETSLIVSGNEMYDYDNTVYEQMMFHFNTTQRCNYYKHVVEPQDVPGLCHCYDCAAEVQVLAAWAKKFPNEWADSDSPTEDEIAEHVAVMTERLNKECSAIRRDLSTKVTASWHKRNPREIPEGWDTNTSPANHSPKSSPKESSDKDNDTPNSKE